MSSIISPHSSESRSSSQLLVAIPPDIRSITFQNATSPSVDLLQQPSREALASTFTNCFRTLGCAGGLTTLCAPLLSSPAVSRALSKVLAHASHASHCASLNSAHSPKKTRVSSSPLSPKITPIVDRVKDLRDSECEADSSAHSKPSPSKLIKSPDSDDAEGDSDDCQEESFSLARPLHVEIEPGTDPDRRMPEPDPKTSMDRDRAAASEAAYRSRIGSDLAMFRAAFPKAHRAAARANVTGSAPPDILILLDNTPLSDLARIHSYAMKTLWSLRHLIAKVLQECSPCDMDTSRLRQVFEDEASLDRHLARQITEEAECQDPQPQANNPVSIALADPRAGPRALALVLEMVPYDYDPTACLAAQIAILHLSATVDGLRFDGLEKLLKLTDNVEKLPDALLDTLDMRSCYKALAQKLVGLRQHHFQCRHRGVALDWNSDVSQVLADLRDRGSQTIPFSNFSRLVTMLDDFHAASIDFANAYRTPPAQINHTIAAVSVPPVSQPDELTYLRARNADFEAFCRVSSSLTHAQPNAPTQRSHDTQVRVAAPLPHRPSPPPPPTN